MFDREIRTLIIILVIFDVGYLFRFVYDIEFSDSLEQFSTDVMFLFLSIFCDFMPISVLILFHFRNFREKPQAEEDESFELGGETVMANEKHFNDEAFSEEAVCTMQLLDRTSFSDGKSP